MMKKIFIFLGAVLLILLIVSVILSSQSAPYPNKPSQIPSLPSSFPSAVPTTIKNILPYKTEYFTIDYSVQQDKYTITKKNPLADNQINNWLKENSLEDKITNNNTIVINDFTGGTNLPNNLSMLVSPTQSPANLLVDLMNIFLSQNNNISSYNSDLSSSPSPILSPSQQLSSTKKPKKNPASTPRPQSGLVYYPQCSGDYDNYPLPDGCTICQAGCGSTTAAMILASYVDKKYDPENVADIYGQRGYKLDCGGSSYVDAKSLFSSYGLKTSDYIIANDDGYTIDEVAVDLKKYIKAGWTIFMLARFNAGGHYFWITDIDANNNVLAYDPYYGRLTIPPFNENQYYPNPKYRVAFGVKKL